MLVLADEDLPIGCLLTVTLLGVIEAKQTESDKTVRNDRHVAKVSQSRAYADLADIAFLGDAFTDELTGFFIASNELKGKRLEVVAIAARAPRLRAGRADQIIDAVGPQ